MSTPDEEPFPSYRAKQALIDAAWERCEGRFAALPPPLGDLAAQFLRSIADESGSHRSYFSSPVAPPLLYMPLWLMDGLSRDRDRSRADQTMVRILAATMQGYIGVRLQDNVLDEPTRADPNLLLLGNTCFSNMIVELSTALGMHGIAFWPALDRAIVDFSHLTLAEQHAVLRDEPYTVERFDEHADKVALARIPLLAVAAIAERLDLEPSIRTLVHQLGIAYGIANDVLGWPRDVRSGHRTWLLGCAGFARAEWEHIGAIPEGAERDATSSALVEKLRTALYEGRLIRDAIARAISVHRDAMETARAAGLVGFDDYTAERIAWLETLDKQTALMTLKRALLSARS